MAKTTRNLIQYLVHLKSNSKTGDLSMREVPNENYIASDDMAKIRQRLVNQISGMSDAELRIAAKSEASLRAFVADLFKSIAKLFGYIVGQVVGFGKDIVRSIGDGWSEGWKAGLG
ncbi:MULTISPECIES: hypothetical protein [unclassified Microcoleus]|uniref:hypothetical protein n=2 Tax=unclassified Microcoleus TaxID=2642155 RepID=UPI002FCF48D6